MEALSAEKWSLCLDNEGRVLDQYNVRKIVFHKGICEDIRHEVWPFLLGYYPFNSTSEERKRIDDEKSFAHCSGWWPIAEVLSLLLKGASMFSINYSHNIYDVWSYDRDIEETVRYESLLASWSKSNNFEEFDDNFAEDAKIIEKDSRRTDRTSDFFSDENIHNVHVLERLLKTFALLRPEIGYVQGMSDIMALPLMVLNNEHQTFWCFDSIMKTVGRVFADLTLSEPLEDLAKLCRHVDKPLFDHLDHIYEGDQWLFAYRLVLLNFKRELSIDGCSRLWECYWSCHATQHFPLLFKTSLLLHFRDTLLKYTDFEQLMQFSQNLRGKIPVNEVLSQAIDLLDQLKSDELCPHDIKFLVSNQVSAPPPLVGFVRTRQRVTSLFSRKFDVQRDQIWRALFGDTPLQSITSPFMLSPPETSDSVRSSNWNTPRNDSNWNTPNYTTNGPHSSLSFDSTSSGERQTTSLSPRARAPPKVGFIPRGTNSYHLREDIRRIRLSSAYSESSFTDDSLTETDVVRSNGSATNSCTVSVDAHQIPLSNPTCENESDRVGEFENQSHGCNQLSHNNFRSTSSGHLPSNDSTNQAACYGNSQFDSLRSEAELPCF